MIDHISTAGVRCLSKPFEYKKDNSTLSSYLCPLQTFDNLRPITFMVGSREYTTLASSGSLKFDSGALYDEYIAYWTDKADEELVSGHIAALGRESVFKIHPSVTDPDSIVFIEISDGLIKRPLRSEVFGEKILNDIISLLESMGTFTANEVAAALTSRGITWTASGNPAATIGIELSDVAATVYIDRKYFGHLMMNVIGTKYGCRYGQIILHPNFVDITGISVARLQELLPQLEWAACEISGATWNWPMTNAQWEETFPELAIARGRVALLFGVNSEDITWGSNNHGNDGYFRGFYMMVPEYASTVAKSNILGGVFLEVLFSENEDSLSKQYEWRYLDEAESATANTGRLIVCKNIYCYYALDELVKRLDGEATIDIKTFVSTHPGTAIAYSYQETSLFAPGEKLLETTSLYLDAQASGFDLYNQELFAGKTFKSASNRANEICTIKDSPLVMLVPGMFAAIDKEWTFTEYSLAHWVFANDGDVTGSYENKVVYLNASNSDDLDDIELVFNLASDRVFETTEAEFLQIWFSVSSVDQLCEYKDRLTTINLDKYTLDPLKLSPSGFISRRDLSLDEFKRLAFIAANSTTADLIGAVEGALATHFIW